MLEIGKYNTLEVVKHVDFGIYLNSELGEILMPIKYVPEGIEPGDELKVFIYKDSEDRLIANSLTPHGIVGEFANLKVKQVNSFGAFMDWGLEKDLLVPHAEQHRPMQEGQNYIVRIVLDPKTERIIGISKLSPFLSKNIEELEPGLSVDLLIYEITDLGYMALINEKFRGILYKNEVFQSVAVGDKLIGYIKKLREDGKIDLTLKKFGYKEIDDAKEIIYEKLISNKGFLNFSDSSSPEEIKLNFNMSKKNFKKAIGTLYKEGRISLEVNSIRINKL